MDSPKPSVLTDEPATAETAGTAYQLLREFVFSIGKESEFTTTEEQFRRAMLLDPPLTEVVVAKYRGEVAGYGQFYRMYDSWSDTASMHISAVYIDSLQLLRALARISEAGSLFVLQPRRGVWSGLSVP